jgi:hypothetical protein
VRCFLNFQRPILRTHAQQPCLRHFRLLTHDTRHTVAHRDTHLQDSCTNPLQAQISSSGCTASPPLRLRPRSLPCRPCPQTTHRLQANVLHGRRASQRHLRTRPSCPEHYLRRQSLAARTEVTDVPERLRARLLLSQPSHRLQIIDKRSLASSRPPQHQRIRLNILTATSPACQGQAPLGGATLAV